MSSKRVPTDRIEFRPHSVDWTEQKVARFWDYLAETDAGEFFSEKHSRDIAGMLIQIAHPGAVVDIGCGTGALAAELGRRGVRAVGVDSSEDALRAASARAPDASFRLGSVASLPLADDSMDAALLIEVVEHLDDATLGATLTEARRVLRQRGVLLVTTPNAETLSASTRECPDCGARFHIYQHVRRWTRESLHAALADHAFRPQVREVRFVENGPWPEVLARRVYYRLRGHRPRLMAIAVKP